jgi:hypothetical protein
MPKGPAKFVPKIYGFKIFGMRGSKYELKFDYQGKPVNEEDIRKVLKKPYDNSSGDRVLTGLGAGPALGMDSITAPQPQMYKQNKDTMMEETPQTKMGGTKKKFEDEEMQ